MIIISTFPPAYPEAIKAQAIAAYTYVKFNGNVGSGMLLKPNPPQNVINAVAEVLGQACYYNGDPRKNPDAKLIPTVETVDERIIALGGGSGSSLGTGGMATKLLAAQIAVGAGCEMVIANGEKPELLYDIVAGKPIGTRFLVKR